MPVGFGGLILLFCGDKIEVLAYLCEAFKTERVVSVSYTHLDVYKRQVYKLGVECFVPRKSPLVQCVHKRIGIEFLSLIHIFFQSLQCRYRLMNYDDLKP